MSLEINVLGVGDTFSEVYYPTALLLFCEGVYLAIDCPDRYRAVLRDFRKISGRQIQVQEINDFIVTHVHGDHMNGLEGVGFFCHATASARPRLHMLPDVARDLWGRLAGGMGSLWDGERHHPMALTDYFQPMPLYTDDAVNIGPFNVQARYTRHHIPATVLLINAGGQTVGFSGDTSFDPNLIHFVKDADLIIHETNFGPAHTSIDDLLALPQPIRSKLRLIHYPDGMDLRDALLPLLTQGEIITLG
ncbi:MAG: hypothetical protein A2289_21250 [Deltaproteobacteria bacterium RIFOXYA12_FULL_58_15]|nr:MAG: hypothetical protein A2289_21250 [Deltaproteobacteria bacterium RIFOXYA12_FULL_58_15]OGR08732.1 MAG: hypothetical protein A2341_00860 [Deltaproteobacteria bacterium RIFOXYB12_FULL_58_9]